MTYKGYTAKLIYSEEDSCFVGRVLGIRHIIGFHGDSVEELRQAFEESIDFYLSTEPAPEKPFSGKFVVRISSECHAEAARLAEAAGKSLNQFVDDAIRRAIEEVKGRKVKTSPTLNVFVVKAEPVREGTTSGNTQFVQSTSSARSLKEANQRWLNKGKSLSLIKRRQRPSSIIMD
ncbi:MAG: type II toxin-antitoxin system HicB family antitoxin [Thermaceae bacterium]|nr:type II toxin-antitoxin system HicB family antitoxin [Thermaceae bacterium]